MHDTPPKIDALARRMLLAHPAEDRLAMGSQMFEVARAMALASMPRGLSELEIRIRLCERLYGNEVDLEAFSGRIRHP